MTHQKLSYPILQHALKGISDSYEYLIIEKENQGTKDINDLVKGQITAKLSRPGAIYRNGAKVKIMLDPTDWRYKTMGPAIFVGRVQYVLNHINGLDVK